MDRWRPRLALAAAAVAGVNVLVALTGQGIVLPIVAGIATLGALASLALALWPTWGSWSRARRALAAAVAVGWVVVVAVAYPLTFLYGCMCEDTAAVAATRVVAMTLSISAPVLLLIAAAVPARRAAYHRDDLD